jgi:hypothetical protein
MIVGYEHVNDRLSEDRDVENQRKWVEAPGGFQPPHRGFCSLSEPSTTGNDDE